MPPHAQSHACGTDRNAELKDEFLVGGVCDIGFAVDEILR